MTIDCATLSPRPTAIRGPISTISVDNFLGLENDKDVDSSRSSQDEFVDVEPGNQEESKTEEKEPNPTPGVGR